MKPRPNELVFHFKIVFKLYLAMVRFRASKNKIFNTRESHFRCSKTKKSGNAWLHPYTGRTPRDNMSIWTPEYKKITKYGFANLKSLRMKPRPNKLVFHFKIVYKLYLTIVRFRKSKNKLSTRARVILGAAKLKI